MKYFLSFVLLTVFHSGFSQTQGFEFEKVWELVYQQELQGKPKRASALVDSIYTAASESELEDQMLKALIYQSKFMLILEEEGQSAVIRRFSKVATQNKGHLKRITQSILAGIFKDYYQRNSYRIQQRTDSDFISPDFMEWGKGSFRTVIDSLYMSSLDFPESELSTALQGFEEVLEIDDFDLKYRPLLFDFLAFRALDYLDYYRNYNRNEASELVSLRSNNALIGTDAHFAKVDISEYPPDEPLVRMIEILQQLERLHRQDNSPEARADVFLERLKVFTNQLTLLNSDSLRMATLDQAIPEYNQHEVVARLLFEKARVQKTQGDKYSDENPVYQYEYNKALETCKRAISEFPKSLGASQCQTILGEIQETYLGTLMTEVILPEKPAKMLIRHNNIDKVYITTYRVPVDSIFLNQLRYESAARQEVLSGLVKTASWSVRLRNESDYRTRSTEIVFPAHSKGQYFVVISKDASGLEHLAWDYFQVSYLAAVKVGESPKKHLFQVINRWDGGALAGVRVTPKMGSASEAQKEDTSEITSDSAGQFSYAPAGRGGENVRFLLETSNDRLLTSNYFLYQRDTPSEIDAEEYGARLNIFTDRTIYRLGQKLYFKAILAKLRAEGREVFPGQEITIFLTDMNDQKLDSVQVVTNEFGSVTGHFELPDKGQTGQYLLEVNQETTGDALEDYEDIVAKHYFSVEEYKRPTFEVFASIKNEAYALGDSLLFKGMARGYAGNSISGAKVQYSITRRSENRLDYSRRPGFGYKPKLVAQGSTTTDAMGEFHIHFAEKIFEPPYKQDGTVFAYTLQAEVTDLNGETRTISTGISVGKTAFKVAIWARNTDISQSAPDMTIRAYNWDMDERKLKGRLEIVKLKTPGAVKREAPWTAPFYTDISKEEHEKIFRNYPYQDELNADRWPEGQVYFSDSIYTSHTSPPEIGNFSAWSPGIYRLKFSTVDPTGDTLSVTRQIEFTDYQSPKLLPFQRFSIGADKAAYAAGETALLKIGTAAKGLKVYVQVKREELSPGPWQIFDLSNERQVLEVPITNADKKSVKVHYYYVFENTLEQGTHEIRVIEKQENLIVKLGTFRDLLEPGKEEQWQMSIHGAGGEAVEAEVLASMYDVSLDAFLPHQWRPDLSTFRYSYSPHPLGSYSAFSNTSGRNVFGGKHWWAPSPDYARLKWFGFNFMNVSYANKTYLEKLRWRKNPQPFVKASKRDLPKGIIKGVVIDESGEPVANISISLSSGKTTKTQPDGTFSAEKGNASALRIAFIGYLTFSVDIEDNNYFEIQLIADANETDEVVVVGYGDQAKKEISASYAIVEVADEEELEPMLFYNDKAGRADLDLKTYSYRPLSRDELGLTSAQTILERLSVRFPEFDPARTPLTFQDGKEVDLLALDSIEVYSIQVLNATKAMALYGEKGANGALLITTVEGLREQAAQLHGIKARTDLKETAFFFPQLKTDEEGKVTFSFTTPEALSRWKLQVLAHDESMNIGQLTKEVQTQKSLMIIPNVPRFFREGDQFTFNAKITSLSADTLNGFARLEFMDALSGSPVQLYTGNDQPIQQFRLTPKGSQSIEWSLRIPEGLEAVTYRIVASAGGFTDGEESVIPVLTNRIMVQESLPLWVTAGEKRSFSLDKLRASDSPTLAHYKLSLNLTTNPVWEAIRSLPYLMEYPYECVEQTFARFYANSLGSHLVKSRSELSNALAQWRTKAPVSKLEQNPELRALLIQETPWIREAKSEKQQQERLALLLDAERMETEFTSQLANLRQMQMASGAFPWFKGGRENRYITSHVLAGLRHLSKLTDDHIFADILAKGNAYLDQAILRDYTQWKKASNREERLSHAQVQYLYVQSFNPGRERKEPLTEAIAHYQQLAFESWLQMDLQSQAMIALYAHRIGQEAQARQMAGSIKEYGINSAERGTFWKSNVSGWYNYEAPIETQAVLIEMFEELGAERDFIDELKQWILSEKRTKAWKSTKATTEAIYALLLNGRDQLKSNRKVSVKLGGKRVLNTKGKSTDALAGYHAVLWNGESVKPKMGKVRLRNKGQSVVFGALHWQYFENLEQITPSIGPLSLRKEVFKVVNTQEGEQLKSVADDPLQVGDLIRVRMVLKSDRSMEFIHLKDMRASGLEPVNVLSGYHWQDGLSYYESTRDVATHFFIEYLPQGTYVFEYDLRVTVKGTFSNGITSIQNMYAPEFSSHSKGLVLEIKE